LGLISVREYHGVGGTGIAQLLAADKFPDTPDVSTFATYFEWPNSGDIEVPPAANIRDNYGWSMMGYIYPPETGDYIFSLATDDNSQLFLSTDESPANARMIASQGGWQPVRDYRVETTSAEIFLEAGNAYFIELVIKEGGGGDNAAVAWSLPEDGPTDVEPGALPFQVTIFHRTSQCWTVRPHRSRPRADPQGRRLQRRLAFRRRSRTVEWPLRVYR